MNCSSNPFCDGNEGFDIPSYVLEGVYERVAYVLFICLAPSGNLSW